MKANSKSAIFILSNGRPNTVITRKVLKQSGYVGKIYIVVDNEDPTVEQYKKKFKDEVIVFSKKDYVSKFDIMDNFEGNKVIVYARNACYDIARDLGLDYFFEYEDDYVSFNYRYVDKKMLKSLGVKNLNEVLDAMIECLVNTNSTTIAFAQGGDFIGGAGSFAGNTFKRKAMNSFCFKVNKDPLDDCLFIGRMNDDVNTYLTQGSIGKLFFQISSVMLVQKATQSNPGGNTEAYKISGTYIKSFYSVVAAPSCCRISVLGTVAKRIHHRITWVNAVPLIIREEYKKKVVVLCDNDKNGSQWQDQ
jgi:hypothetical protein